MTTTWTGDIEAMGDAAWEGPHQNDNDMRERERKDDELDCGRQKEFVFQFFIYL